MTVPSDYAFVAPSYTKHLQRTTIQHWQLRDLISSPGPTNEVYYVYKNAVNKYNATTREVSVVQELEFLPTSMTVGCGYVAAGGQSSQLVLKHIADDSKNYHARVGGSINNALNISFHEAEVRLMISNNDYSVKVFSLPSMTLREQIVFPTAINYVSVSNDGHHMVAVGDTNQVFLYDTRGAYREIATFAEATDAGHSCCWNSSSSQFASASQDGSVTVWDIRSSRVLARLFAKQGHSGRAACRSVKFSPRGAIDLLMFTEHVSHLHMVDARTYNSQQTIRVAPPNRDQNISGAAFSQDCTRIFCGMEEYVVELEVDTVGRRSFGEGSALL